MDAQTDEAGQPQAPDGDPQRILINENPLSGYFQWGLEFIQGYGWFLVLGVIVFLYFKSKLSPTIEKYRQQAEDARAKRNYDPGRAQEKLEAMEAARRRMQEQFDSQAARYAEQQKIKEEEKRQQKIEDWDGHLEGKGYRSKYKVKEDKTEEKKPLPKSKLPKSKPLRQSDYNPLTGDSGASCSWRPASRGGGGGGG